MTRDRMTTRQILNKKIGKAKAKPLFSKVALNQIKK